MDFAYFLDDARNFRARRLPSPKQSAIRFKDVSDLYELREEIRDSSNPNERQFQQLYNHVFDSYYAFDVEVEEFDDAVQANRQKLLGKYSWLKKHWDILYSLFDDDDSFAQSSLSEEWHSLDEQQATAFIKAEFVEQKDPLTLEYTDWSNHLHDLLLADLKDLAKPRKIKLSQKKADLVRCLVNYEEENPGSLVKPTFFRPTLLLSQTIQAIQTSYVDAIETALTSFDYPKPFKIAIWLEVEDLHSGSISQMATAHLKSLGYLSEVLEEPPIVTQTLAKNNNYQVNISYSKVEKSDTKPVNSLPNSCIAQFSYISNSGEMTTRRVRVDKIEQGQNDSYIKGFCYLRNALRTFNMSRIVDELIIVGTGEVIQLDEDENTDIIIKALTGKNTTQKTALKVEPNSLFNSSLLPDMKTRSRWAVPEDSYSVETKSGIVKFLLFVAIVFIPYIFAWFTLSKHYSIKWRMAAFGWLIFALWITLTAPDKDRSTEATAAVVNLD